MKPNQFDTLYNRRKFLRIDFDGKVNLKFDDNNYDCCRIKNLCLTGICVKTDLKNQVSKRCFIKIFHNEKFGNNSICASAKVVWINDEDVGLKFTKMTLENYILLQTTLTNKAKQPEIILREFPLDYPFEVNED